MTHLSRTERLALLDLMDRVGPHAPTLCAGWDTADLAAHLVVRERRPDSAIGIVLPPLADRGERIRRRYRHQDFGRLLALLRDPPWWSPVSNPLIDPLANTVEFFVHHEDVRRAAPGWKRRELPRTAQDLLWARTAMARMLLRKSGLNVELVAPGHGRRAVGRGDGVDAVVTGPPSELLLFCFGRKSVAQVDVTGPAAGRLLAADLGL
jgi:uncharacterized protein (TIGR03085 family)